MATKKKAAKKKATKANGARKKTTKRATATTKAGKPRASTQLEPLQIRGNLFLEYRAAIAELFEARSRLKLLENRLKQELADEKYKVLLKIQNGRNDALRDVATRQGAFKDLQARICQKFGIEMDQLVNYTINEYSGAIVFTPPKEEGEPANTKT